MGALDAKVIMADKVAVEDRIILKCRVGCANFGKTLTCPPHTPTAEEFRKVVSEYSNVLFMKFQSQAQADPELAKHLLKAETDSSIPKDLQDKIQKVWAAWKEDKLNMLSAVLDLEKAAMNKGYPLAIGLVSGYCQLCEKCTLDRTTCAYPAKARCSESAVGVNVKVTAMMLASKLHFHSRKTPNLLPCFL